MSRCFANPKFVKLLRALYSCDLVAFGISMLISVTVLLLKGSLYDYSSITIPKVCKSKVEGDIQIFVIYGTKPEK